MNVEIGTEAPIFLSWEYLFQIFGILSLQCVMYPKGAPVRQVKISPGHKILLTGPWAECCIQSCKVPVNMKIFENTFPPYEDLQILGILFTSYITPHTTLGYE